MTSQNHGGRDLPEMRPQVERAGAAVQGMAQVAALLSGRLSLEASTLLPAVAAARHGDLHSSGPAEASATKLFCTQVLYCVKCTQTRYIGLVTRL